MKIQRIKTSLLDMNEGQVAGLPTNPRQWTQTDIDRIAESLKETPELFEARPCIVYPHDGRYVILGGNLRYNGAQKNGDADVPCVVIPAETPLDTLKAIVIKDNGSFGAWDYDALGNEWDSLPLSDWGVPAWSGSSDIDFGALTIEPVSERGESKTGLAAITFVFSQEDAAIVNEYIKEYSKESVVNKIVEICRNAEAR